MAWSSGPCSRGHIHWNLKQQSNRSCGAACAAMAIFRKKGEMYLDTDLIKKYGKDASKDTDIVPLLELYGVRATLFQRLSQDDLKSKVRAATTSKPVIAAVIWQGANTGHWVMIEGRTTHFRESSEYCICDPEYGTVVTSLTAAEISIQFKAGPKGWPGLQYTPLPTIIGVLKGTVVVVS
jgi:hypothetical protein